MSSEGATRCTRCGFPITSYDQVVIPVTGGKVDHSKLQHAQCPRPRQRIVFDETTERMRGYQPNLAMEAKRRQR